VAVGSVLLAGGTRPWRSPLGCAGAFLAALLLRLGSAPTIAESADRWAGFPGRRELALTVIVVLALAAGTALCGATALAGRHASAPRRRGGAIVVLLTGVVAGWIAWVAALAPLRTGFFLLAAQRAGAMGRSAAARDLAREAVRAAVDPGRSALYLATIERGETLDPDALDRAREVVLGALDASPFDSDLVGNLGRLELDAAVRSTGSPRNALLTSASARFERALEMRPFGGPWDDALRRARALEGSDETPMP
ncbi:MAG: hypothetical protein R2991_17050, partial [Thermoanaerobaculia bacterium]